MPTFIFNKLVRDKIPDDQRKEGSKPLVRTLKPHEHKVALVNKLHEESQELLGATTKQAAEELADLQQIIDDLCTLYNADPAQVQQVKAAKQAKSGGFSKGLYIESLETSNVTWTEYYRKSPNKYPEVTS